MDKHMLFCSRALQDPNTDMYNTLGKLRYKQFLFLMDKTWQPRAALNNQSQ